VVLALALGTASTSSAAQPRTERWALASSRVEARVDADGSVSVSVSGGAWHRVGRGTPRVERVPVAAGEALIVRVEGPQPGAAIAVGAPTILPTIVHAAPSVSNAEDIADRTSTEVVVRENAGRREIVVGVRRNDVTLCGLGSPLVDTRVLDGTTLRLVPRAVDPFSVLPGPSPTAIAIAAVPAEPNARAVGIPALVAQGQSAEGVTRAPAFALTDRSASTAWSAGELDFATVRLIPGTLAIERVLLTAPPAGASLPRALSIVLGPQRFDVTIAEGLAGSGGRVAIPIVPARPSSCIAIVARAHGARGTTAIAELSVATALDREQDPYTALARMLDGPSTEADGAAQALAALGARAVSALAVALPTLSTAGAHRALRVLSAQHSSAAAEAMVAAMAREDVAEHAREVLVRMGDAALAGLSRMIATDARAADLLLALRAARSARMRAMLPALTAERVVWRRVRGPLVALLHESTEDEQRAWLSELPREPSIARLRALAALVEGS
jgi:hypothetical protein